MIPGPALITPDVLNLLLLNFLDAFAAEVLKISKAPVVLDIIYHSCKILLLR